MRSPPLWILALTLAAFTIQTDDFIVLGVLPELADDLSVSETAAGQLVTVYSLTYAVTAPLWALLLTRLPTRATLLTALAVFGAANLVVPLVDTYTQLMAVRVVAALAGAVVLPAALALAGTRAPLEQRGRYLATVMTGLTAAVLVGVPAGAWTGATLGWAAAFVLCGTLGVFALVVGGRTLPEADGTVGPVAGEKGGTGQPTSVRGLLRPLVTPSVVVLLVATALAVAGNLAFQTYLAPFLADTAGATPHTLAAVLVAVGTGGLVGTQGAGRSVDRFGAEHTLRFTLVLFCAAMVVLLLVWNARPVPILLVTAVLVVWSAAAWAVPPALQALVLDRVGPRVATQAMAVQSSSVHLGAALGGVAGGAAVAVSTGLLPVAAATTAALALLVVMAGAKRGAPGPLPPRAE
ncbi:MFS transporter [Nocardiopsis kunsanensis]|uniref:MFS transporter n=1 Tax=Nocardiopsis kunsanensis TaxID=141693 RepID=UPI00034C5EAF|nr:MFS transporter [Nocardiopsis kunsanensis]